MATANTRPLDHKLQAILQNALARVRKECGGEMVSMQSDSNSITITFRDEDGQMYVLDVRKKEKPHGD